MTSKNPSDDQPKKNLSKKETFEILIESLEEKHQGPFPEEEIIFESVKTGKFNKIQAQHQLERYHQDSYLYEPTPGFFKRA